MSTAIVLPSLTNWTKDHLTTILQATNDADFTSAVDAFLSDKVDITLNGTPVSRADFVSQLQAEKSLELALASITFAGDVEVPADPEQQFLAGSVGVFYNAIITERLKVLGGPVSNQVTASVNVDIIQDPDVPKPSAPPSPIHGFPLFDGRRVKVLNQVSVQTRAPPVIV